MHLGASFLVRVKIGTRTRSIEKVYTSIILLNLIYKKKPYSTYDNDIINVLYINTDVCIDFWNTFLNYTGMFICCHDKIYLRMY